MPSRALLLLNPRARRGAEAAGDIAAGLRRAGLELVVEPTEDPATLAGLIRRHAAAVDRVVVAGGDGTINRTVQVLVDVGLPMAIIPAGTANNMARTVGLPLDLEGAIAVAAGPYRRPVDLGRVNGRWFCTTASIGLSVQITEELSPDIKRRLGPVAYALAALKVMRRSHPFHAEVTWEGGKRHSRTVQIVVGNGRYYGAALAVTPDATIDDASLDLYSLEVNRWWELLKVAPFLKWGTHIERPEVEALRAKAFDIRTRRPMPIDLDGELGAETPARFEVVPRALEVFTPESAPA
ncbi:MAG TPA: lipid kinase [Gemmatimonadales bacterium]|nr:lipid kinase [Gemmatimonadales bacterium]